MSGASSIEFDHRRIGLPRWYFVNNPDIDPDDPDDQEALHASCHKRRTKKDAAMIAKTKRLSGERGGQRVNRLVGSGRRPIPQRPDSWGYRR